MCIRDSPRRARRGRRDGCARAGPSTPPLPCVQPRRGRSARPPPPRRAPGSPPRGPARRRCRRPGPPRGGVGGSGPVAAPALTPRPSPQPALTRSVRIRAGSPPAARSRPGTGRELAASLSPGDPVWADPARVASTCLAWWLCPPPPRTPTAYWGVAPAMSHVAIPDTAAGVTVQPGAVVSKVVHRDDQLDVTVFGFDAGEGLTEHQAAIVQVLAGRLRFTVEGAELDPGPGFWLQMAPGAPHTLTAVEPTIMLLTLLKS